MDDVNDRIGVHVAGLTPHPHQEWMSQIARNVQYERTVIASR